MSVKNNGRKGNLISVYLIFRAFSKNIIFRISRTKRKKRRKVFQDFRCCCCCCCCCVFASTCLQLQLNVHNSIKSTTAINTKRRTSLRHCHRSTSIVVWVDRMPLFVPCQRHSFTYSLSCRLPVVGVPIRLWLFSTKKKTNRIICVEFESFLFLCEIRVGLFFIGLKFVNQQKRLTKCSRLLFAAAFRLTL